MGFCGDDGDAPGAGLGFCGGGSGACNKGMSLLCGDGFGACGVAEVKEMMVNGRVGEVGWS